jgi:hypothetical protein
MVLSLFMAAFSASRALKIGSRAAHKHFDED